MDAEEMVLCQGGALDDRFVSAKLGKRWPYVIVADAKVWILQWYEYDQDREVYRAMELEEVSR